MKILCFIFLLLILIGEISASSQQKITVSVFVYDKNSEPAQNYLNKIYQNIGDIFHNQNKSDYIIYFSTPIIQYSIKKIIKL